MKKWTTTKIKKEHVCFLDKLANQSQFSGGKNFSRDCLIRVTLEAFQKLKINVKEVKTEEEFAQRIKDAFIGHKGPRN